MGKRTIKKKRNSLRIKRSKNKKRSKTKILSKYSRKKLKKTKMRKRYGGTPRIPESYLNELIEEWLRKKERGIFSGRSSLSCFPPNYISEEITMFLESKKIDAENYVMGLIDKGFTMYRLKVTPEVYKLLIMAKNNNSEVIPQTAEATIDYRFNDFIKLKSHADPRISTSALSLQKAGNCYDRIMSINKLLSEISISYAQSVTSEMCLELDKNYSGDWQAFTSLFRKAFNCGVPFDKIREQEKIIEENIQRHQDRLTFEMRKDFKKNFPKGKFELSSPRKRELFYKYFWLLFKDEEGDMQIIESIVENLKRNIRENNTKSYELRSSKLTLNEGTQKSPEPATGDKKPVETSSILRGNPSRTEEELRALLNAPLEHEGAWNPGKNLQTMDYRKRRKDLQKGWEDTIAHQQQKASVNPDSSDREKLNFGQDKLMDYNHPNIRTISDFVGPGDLKENGEECISENECMSLSCKGGVCTSGDEES